MNDEIVLNSEYEWTERTGLEEPLIMDSAFGWTEYDVYPTWRSRLLDWWYDHRPRFHFGPCPLIHDWD